MKYFVRVALFVALAVAAVPAQAAKFTQYVFTVSVLEDPISAVIKPCTEAAKPRSANGWLAHLTAAGYQRCEVFDGDIEIALECPEGEITHVIYIYESLRQCRSDHAQISSRYRILTGQ